MTEDDKKFSIKRESDLNTNQPIYDFSSISEWDEKKIAQFLIWDHVENMSKIGPSDFRKLLTRDYRVITKKYKKYKIIIGLIDNLYNNFFLRLAKEQRNANKKILFGIGVKYPSIILKTKKHHSLELIVRGERGRLFSAKNFISYISITDLIPYVYYFFSEEKMKYLYQIVKKMEEKLGAAKPDYIVLVSDEPPLERAIVLASKKLGIVTLEIQHGAYSPTLPLTTGKVADYVLVWGEYFKDLYVKRGLRKPEEVYVLGYPYLIEKPKLDYRKKRHYTVCYLGENFEKYNKDLLNIKLETISSLYKTCNRWGLTFIYRPHPGEDRKMLKDRLREVIITPKGENLEKTFKKGDIFISFSSTALIEAALRSKIALQLMNYPWKGDNFEKLGVCSKSFKTIRKLDEYFKELAKAPGLNEFKPKFNNNYIETRYNPCKRFLEILDDIGKKRKKIKV